MSDLRAGLGRHGARRDRPFAGQPPPAVVAAVAFAALLAGAAQVAVQRAAAALVGPDVAVDGFVTDREQVEAAQPPRHLLGAPIFPEQLLDLRPVGRREPLIPPGARAAAAGVPLGELGPVAAVARRAVAPHLRPIVLRWRPSTRAIAAAARPRCRSRPTVYLSS